MVCAVTFQRHGRLYYADPGGLSLQVGDQVLYPTNDGPEVAEVMWAPQYVSEEIGRLPVLVGAATASDLERAAVSHKKRASARVAARRLIRDHDLPMKVVGVDYVDDRIHYHHLLHRAAPRRLPGPRPRSLRDPALPGRVAAALGPRLRPLTGGVGSCSRDLCCSTFLIDFEPVSVRMVKDQDLPLNPLRISGACGRLMCCLKYEHPLYQDFPASARHRRARHTPEGPGRVVGHSVPSRLGRRPDDSDGRVARVRSRRYAGPGRPRQAPRGASHRPVDSLGAPAGAPAALAQSARATHS